MDEARVDLARLAAQLAGELLEEARLGLGQALAEHVLEVVRHARRLPEEQLPVRGRRLVRGRGRGRVRVRIRVRVRRVRMCGRRLAQVREVERGERLFCQVHAAHAVEDLVAQVGEVGQLGDGEVVEVVDARAAARGDLVRVRVRG